MADEATRTEIGSETLVTGDIRADEDVVVFGRVQGTVTSSAAVIVEDGGEVRTRVEAATVIVAGRVEGDVVGTDRIEVTETGRVLGNLFTPRLVLLDGGAVRGRVSMDGSRPDAKAGAPATRTATARPATPAPAASSARRPVSATRSAAREPASRGRASAPRAPAQLDLGTEET